MFRLLGWFQDRKKKQRRNIVHLFLTGFVMGSADIVPGVSGGTIAFILGVYEEFVESVKVVSGDALRTFLSGKIRKSIELVPFEFLMPLGFGILAAFVTLAKVISGLLLNYPVMVWAFFFGLVLASIFIVSKRIRSWDASDAVALALSALVAFMIVGVVPIQTPETLPVVFVSGALTISAMILPGVSGSFLLIIMGKYEQLLNAMVNRDVMMLAVFAAGAVVGLAVFSRVLSFLFAKHHDLMVAILTGVMLGSLRKIWPWKEVVTTRINSHGVEVPVTTANVLPVAIDASFLFAVLLALLAVGLILVLEKQSLTKERVADVGDPEFAQEHERALNKERRGLG